MGDFGLATGAPPCKSLHERGFSFQDESEMSAMKLPVQIAFHNMAHDPEIEAAVRANAESFDNYYDKIMKFRVVVDRPHLHHRDGNTYQVRVDLRVPGGELVVKREPSQYADYKSLDTMIRDAFDEARRQIEDYARHQRGETKTHESAPHARVANLREGE
jgi:hypothetical protein